MGDFNIARFFGPLNLFQLGSPRAMGQMIDQMVGTSPQAHIDAVGSLVGKAIVQSSSANAQVISSRLDQVSSQLQNSIQASGADISEHISKGFIASNIINTVGFAAVTAGVMALRKSVQENTNAIQELHAAMAEKFNELIWIAQKQTQGIEKIYDLLRRGFTNDAIQLLEQGERNYQKGFYQEALERFQKALQYDNTLYPVYRNIGMILVHLGRHDEAEEYMKKAEAFSDISDETRITALTDLARYYWAKGDPGKASECYEQALKIKRIPKVLYDLSIVYAEMGKEQEWKNLLREAIEKDPKLWELAVIDPEFEFKKNELLIILDDLYREKNKLRYNIINPCLQTKKKITERLQGKLNELKTRLSDSVPWKNEVIADFQRMIQALNTYMDDYMQKELKQATTYSDLVTVSMVSYYSNFEIKAKNRLVELINEFNNKWQKIYDENLRRKAIVRIGLIIEITSAVFFLIAAIYFLSSAREAIDADFALLAFRLGIFFSVVSIPLCIDIFIKMMRNMLEDMDRGILGQFCAELQYVPNTMVSGSNVLVKGSGQGAGGSI